MAQEYLPAPSNIRLADLMKEHNISQPELAKEIGCSKSTISRFISGAKGTLTHEQVLKIARLFNVSTDFLLGETNIPDRKNYDIAELGLSVEAERNLYTGRVNTEVVCIDTPCVEVLCSFYGQAQLGNVVVLAVRDIGFSQQEIRGHFEQPCNL